MLCIRVRVYKAIPNYYHIIFQQSRRITGGLIGSRIRRETQLSLDADDMAAMTGENEDVQVIG